MRALGLSDQILIVDDEVEIRSVLEEFLSHKGYATRGAPDGRSAVQAICSQLPDLVLHDIDMPELGGIEALNAIRAIAPRVKVIMISGKASLEVAKRSLAHGAYDYIAKPFDLEYLAKSVETALLTKNLDESYQPDTLRR